jgi:tRNA(fMet)-specific endonuclease VapC
MHLLDADTLTHLYHGHARASERLRQCDDPDIGVTIVTKAEILRGRYDALLKAADGEQVFRAQDLLRRTETLLASLAIVLFADVAAHEFDRLRRQRAMKKIGHVDLLVASIALANRATLVTRNVWHFERVPNLSLDNWVD